MRIGNSSGFQLVRHILKQQKKQQRKSKKEDHTWGRLFPSHPHPTPLLSSETPSKDAQTRVWAPSVYGFDDTH